MVTKISPVGGWALDVVVELDRHAAGFAGSYLRSSDERRQVVAAYLSSKPPSADPLEMRDVADFLARSEHRAILTVAYGAVAAGLRGALRRAGSQPHDPRFYWLLNEMLSAPLHREIVPTVNRLATLDLMKLRVAQLLRPEVCRANVVEAVGDVGAATNVEKALDLFVTNGVDHEALFEAVRRVKSDRELADVWRRWILRTVFPDHPVPASPKYLPVRTAADLRRLAHRYHNCAERFISMALDDMDQFAEFKHGGGGLVVHLRKDDGVWNVEGMFGNNNSHPRSELRTEALAYLAAFGIRQPPRHPAATGEWQVLRRLASPLLLLEDAEF